MPDAPAITRHEEPARSNGKHPGGQPTIRTDVNAAIIYEVISDGGSMEEAATAVQCAQSTIRVWGSQDAQFASLLARARKNWAEAWADKGLEMVTAEPQTISGEGGVRVDPGWVSHLTSKLNYIKWLMAKRDRERFGDQPTQVNVGVNVEVADFWKKLRAGGQVVKIAPISEPEKLTDSEE
jgi:hypothetical protein